MWYEDGLLVWHPFWALAGGVTEATDPSPAPECNTLPPVGSPVFQQRSTAER